MESNRRMNKSPLSMVSDCEEGYDDLPRSFAGLLHKRCNEFLDKRNLRRNHAVSWFGKKKGGSK